MPNFVIFSLSRDCFSPLLIKLYRGSAWVAKDPVSCFYDKLSNLIDISNETGELNDYPEFCLKYIYALLRNEFLSPHDYIKFLG